MTSQRIVVCWPEPAGLRSDWAVRHRGLLLMADWCATRRLYPGPGDVVRIVSAQGIHTAATDLHVPSWSLVVACNQTAHGWAQPLLAVAAQIRPLDLPVQHSARDERRSAAA